MPPRESQVSAVVPRETWDDVRAREEALHALWLDGHARVSRLGVLRGEPVWRVRHLDGDGREVAEDAGWARVAVTLTMTA
jgi:hypothetical protein